MTNQQHLTLNDTSVLTQIFDPESTPSASILVDPSLPEDPHIQDASRLAQLRHHERQIISSIETTGHPTDALLCSAYDALSALITQHPDYASAYNNRAQLIRLRYGTDILVVPQLQSQSQSRSWSSASASDKDLTLKTNQSTLHHALTALHDLNTTITLLTPPSPTAPISPSSRRILSQAHTQRAALYHAAAKSLSLSRPNSLSPSSPPSSDKNNLSPVEIMTLPELRTWTAVDYEEAASRDFQISGRYGGEIGRALGVAINPTAKLCGVMVREALRREYGGEASEGETAAAAVL